MEVCEGPLRKVRNINSCFGEDASKLTGSLTLIRTYIEAETRDSRRKFAWSTKGFSLNGEVWDRSHPSDLATRRRRAFVCRRKFMSLNHR